nr:receptor type tyrosine protein phosphatase,protein tyrosine phosphatase receptor type [Hymenolepis microstoma]
MLHYRYFFVIFLSGTCILSVSSRYCLQSWITGDFPVAISIKPGFTKTETTIGVKSVNVSWDFDLSEKFHDKKVKGVPDYPKALKQGTVEYTAVRNSYKGKVKIKVTIDYAKLQKEKCPSGSFQILSETPTRSRVLFTNDEPVNVVFLAYNGTSWMQDALWSSRDFCMERMTPGSTYQLCIAPEDCQNSWNCKTFTTFTDKSWSPWLYDLKVSIEGKDYNWIQLSWAPPKIKRPMSPPVGYIIRVINQKNCLEQVIHYQAPWITETESHHITNRSYNLTLNDGCSWKIITPTEGKLDGYWPDFPGSRRSTWVGGWNTAEIDEQGPIGLFAITIDKLQRDEKYHFEIYPVVYPNVNAVILPTKITAETSAKYSGVDIEPRRDDVKINSRSYTNFLVSEIGARSIHCEQQNPVYKNGAGDRLCNKSDNFVINDLVIPLTPSAMYRIVIGSVQKVFQIPASYIPFRPKIKGIALSSNLISLKLLNLDPTVKNPPAFITRICQVDKDTNCRKEPLYVEVVGSYSLYEGRSVWQHDPLDNSFNLNAHINGTTRQNLFVLLYAYFGDKEVQLYKTEVETRKPSCKNWCIWPAGDWSNTKGRAFGVYESSFTRYSKDGHRCSNRCLPLQEAIDGESGCTYGKSNKDLCDIPVCSEVAPIGCVTDTEYKAGTTWINVEWKNPREPVNPAPNYVVLVTTDSKAEPCRVFGDNTKTAKLPPFIQNVVRSCSREPMAKLLPQSPLNITDLAQNTTYDVLIIPYLADGRLGAVLEKSWTTRLAPPCQVENVQIKTNGTNVTLKWKTKLTRVCGLPTSLLVNISNAVTPIQLPEASQNVSFEHPFEFCHNYTWQFQFENSAGRIIYPQNITTSTKYPDIVKTVPTIFYRSPNLGASYTSHHRFCEYIYALQWGVWPSINKCEINPNNSLSGNTIILPPLEEGLVYMFNARVQPPIGQFDCGRTSFASNWSETLIFYTKTSKSEVKTHNKTVTAYISKTKEEDAENFGCLLPQTEYSGQNQFRYVEDNTPAQTGNTSVCIIVDWIVEAKSASSILGYILEIDRQGNNSCRIIWIPCRDCFQGSSLSNVIPEVTEAINQIEFSCLGSQSGLLKNAERLNTPLYKGTTRLLMGFQSTSYPDDNFHGVVKAYAVKMGSLHLIMEQTWQTNAQVLLARTRMHIVIAAFLVSISILAIVVLIVVKWKRKVVRRDQYMKELSKDEVESGVRESAKKFQSKLVTRLKKAPSPIQLSNFTETVAKYAEDEYAILRDEYKTCVNYSAAQQEEKGLTMEAGVHPENRLRNRYKNICPYDQNRLQLHKEYALQDLYQEPIDIPNVEPIGLIAMSDYVNASVIPSSPPHHKIFPMTGKSGSKGPSAYIAAQAPKKHTVGLFWQAIWDSEVRIIVMLTRLIERDKEKCCPYWPRKQTNEKENASETNKNVLCSETYGNISVTLQSSESGICYIRRVLTIRNTADQNSVPRRIYQLQMTSWDDFMVPRKDDFYIFVKRYWDDLACLNSHSGVPVMVHCSAGVGRTGTFIAIDMLARYIRDLMASEERNCLMNGKEDMESTLNESIYANLTDSGKSIVLQNRSALAKCSSNIDVFQTVLWIRSQRMKAVEQDIQYIFIFDFLSYYIQNLTGEAEVFDDNV